MRRSSDNTRRIASVVKMSRRIVESSAVAGMSPPVRDLTAFLRATGPQPCHVMAGLVPAIHVFDLRSGTWMPGIAGKFTQSAQACLRAGHDDGNVREKRSVALAGIGGKFLFLVGLSFPLLGVFRRVALDRDIGPYLGEFGVQAEPLFQARLGVGLDGVDRAFRLAYPAVDALVGVNDEHVLPFVEAVHGTDFHAVHVLAANAIFVDDVGHCLMSLGWLDGAARPTAARAHGTYNHSRGKNRGQGNLQVSCNTPSLTGAAAAPTRLSRAFKAVRRPSPVG